MISKEKIIQLVSEVLTEEYFIVDISVTSNNDIEILIDGDNGVTIQKCVDVSRYVESGLDRETEDFSLDVSSAGLGRPFKVFRQYKKNIGQKVEVVKKGEKPVAGLLCSVDEQGFDIEVTTKEKPEGEKKKIEVTRQHRYLFDDGAEVKIVITFK
jgi:ribosome maturation factor RimP